MRASRTICLAIGAFSIASCMWPSTRIISATELELSRDDMVLIPEGRHRHMGRTIDIDPFFLDVNEVTTGAYLLCVRDGACSPTTTYLQGEYCNLPHGEERAHHPINCVKYEQAVAFCRWRNARLPSADEWRWAAENRGFRTKFPWGCRRSPPRTCIPAQGFATCPVGGGYATRDGILDMGENVSEWVRTAENTGAEMGAPFERRALSERERDLSLDNYSPGFTGIDVGIRCARDLE